MNSPKPKPLISCLSMLLIGCLLSCEQQTQTKKSIIGDWVYRPDTSNLKSRPYSHEPFRVPWRGIGLSFLNDSILDMHTEFLQQVDSDFYSNKSHFKFLGTTIRYKIQKDNNLSFLTLKDHYKLPRWALSSMLIGKKGFDTLIVTGKDERKFIFTRKEYDLPVNALYDEISMSFLGCHGSCPITNTIIKANGDVIFLGEAYVNELGYYEGKISREKFLEIERIFRKAKIPKLESEYSINELHGQRIQTTFSKNQKIEKSISDHSESGPDELVWAYYSLKYLHEQIKLTKLDTLAIPTYFDIRLSGFEYGDNWCPFWGKSFILWNYIRLGKISDKKFTEKYFVDFHSTSDWSDTTRTRTLLYSKNEVEDLKKIMTDGQYFRFYFASRKSITIDIGFNFFERNKAEFGCMSIKLLNELINMDMDSVPR